LSYPIDGAGPSVEDPPLESTEQGNRGGREVEQEAVQALQQQNITETVGTVGEQEQMIDDNNISRYRILKVPIGKENPRRM
jgi:hypothetical protein